MSVVLEDHYTGDEINAALGARRRLRRGVPGRDRRAALDALRELFRRKALVARQARVCQALLAGGATPRRSRRCASRTCRPAPTPQRCRGAARASSGCRTAPTTPALVAGDGSPLTAAELPTWLRRARLVGLSLESNGGLCRSLLHVRYGCPDQEEVAA